MRQWFTAIVGGNEYTVVLDRIEASEHMTKYVRPFEGELDMWFAEVVAIEPPVTTATARLNAEPHPENDDPEVRALYRAIKNKQVVELHLLDESAPYDRRAGWAIRAHTEEGRGVPLVLRVDEELEEDESFES